MHDNRGLDNRGSTVILLRIDLEVCVLCGMKVDNGCKHPHKTLYRIRVKFDGE